MQLKPQRNSSFNEIYIIYNLWRETIQMLIIVSQSKATCWRPLIDRLVGGTERVFGWPERAFLHDLDVSLPRVTPTLDPHLIWFGAWFHIVDYRESQSSAKKAITMPIGTRSAGKKGKGNTVLKYLFGARGTISTQSWINKFAKIHLKYRGELNHVSL